jgi:hypothetical protein
MENAETILVVILTTLLAINLLLTFVLLIIFIKIANHVKHITEKAEAISDKAEHIAQFFSKAGTSMAFAKVISTVTDAIKARKRKGKRNQDEG